MNKLRKTVTRKEADVTQYGKHYSENKNKKMNNDVYSLRSRVMQYVYRANNLLVAAGLPKMQRVNVRITDTDKKDQRWAGCAMSNQKYCIIWITDKTAKTECEEWLHRVVLHELLHTVYDVGHTTDKDSLMCVSPSRKVLSTEEIDKQFIEIIKNL